MILSETSLHIVENYQDCLPFEIIMPDAPAAPVLFNSPHSGRYYLRQFLETCQLNQLEIRRSEDAYIDELFHLVTQCALPMLKANFPRSWLDVNREPYELDPKLFTQKLPPYAARNSIRARSGFGTIARCVNGGKEIYPHKLNLADALKRIETIYLPYHAALQNLSQTIAQTFGMVIIIDCHSMPSHMPIGHMPNTKSTRADFVLGSRYGTSCAPEITDFFHHFLQQKGFRVAENAPYAGGFITQHYGKPANNIHCLQIEINRALYLNEQTVETTENFASIQQTLSELAMEFAVFSHYFSTQEIAAE